ncbi:MAG: disulfide bond formation protein B [Rhodobacter sp.]|nr:disulfide bond formation protein B [Rhodobacter sp.]
MTRTQLIIAAASGSLALLLGAFGFQMLGYAPCQMCLWQRWPHATAIAIGVLALALPGRVLPLLGALAALTTAGIGVFHTGVERDWWEGLTACAVSGDITGLNAADLLDTSRDVGPPLVKCDEVAWEFLTLSMATWNTLISLGLAGLWLLAARHPRT